MILNGPSVFIKKSVCLYFCCLKLASTIILGVGKYIPNKRCLMKSYVLRLLLVSRNQLLPNQSLMSCTNSHIFLLFEHLLGHYMSLAVVRVDITG